LLLNYKNVEAYLIGAKKNYRKRQRHKVSE